MENGMDGRPQGMKMKRGVAEWKKGKEKEREWKMGGNDHVIHAC